MKDVDTSLQLTNQMISHGEQLLLNIPGLTAVVVLKGLPTLRLS